MLVDPGDASLDWFFPSPRGTRVAYGLSFGGDEQSVLHVIETETGEVLPDRIPFTSNATVAWLPDESGFAVNAGTAPDFERVDKVLLVHRLGQPEPSLPEPIEVREPYCVYPQVSGDGRWLVAITSEVEPRADWIRAAPGRRLAAVPARRRGHVQRRLRRRRLRRRLHRGGAAGEARPDPDRDGGRPADVGGADPGERPRAPLRPAGGRPARRRRAARGVLRRDRARPDGRSEELELPVAGLVSRSASHSVAQPAAANEGTGVAGDEDGFSFVLGAPDRSAGLYRYEREIGPGRRAQAAGGAVPVRRHALRGDGARRRDGRLRGRPSRRSRARRPAGRPLRLRRLERRARPRLARRECPPRRGRRRASCSAHIRGGGEEGTGFHRDGALERKQHSYDDLYAIAEDVAARGIADPARIAVLGGSNGGLMVAVAVTQRPDLWCAACSLVPVTDMLRYHLSPYGETGLREYGDPDDPADAAVLRAYSPYHNIRAGHSSTRRRSSSRERTTCAAPPGTRASSWPGSRTRRRVGRSCCG